MGDNLTAYKRSLIRMWDSFRTEYKGELACTGVKCAVCPVFEDCSNMGGPTGIIDAERAIQNVREWEKKNGTRKCSDIKLEELKQHCIRTIELCERHGGMVGDDRRRQEHEMVLELIEEHEQRQENETWIPVSERLPDDRRVVEVTAYWHETYQTMQGSYYGSSYCYSDGEWWCVPFNNTGEHMQRLDVIAWREVSKPYTKGVSE